MPHQTSNITGSKGVDGVCILHFVLQSVNACDAKVVILYRHFLERYANWIQYSTLLNFQMRNVADMIAKLCHHLPCTLKEVMRTFWNCVWLRKIRYASLLFPNGFIVYQLLLQNAGVFSVCVLDFLSSLVALQLSSSHPMVHGHHSCKQ